MNLDVDKLNHVKEIYALEQSDAAAYKEAVKSIQSKMKVSSPGKKLRVIKNIENKYPNGLYVKEARAILRKQQSYYPTILTDSFIRSLYHHHAGSYTILYRSVIRKCKKCLAGIKKGIFVIVMLIHVKMQLMNMKVSAAGSLQ